MTNQEVVAYLSREQGKPVFLKEAEEINQDLTALAEILIDSYLDFKKRGVIDAKGNFIKKPEVSP